MKTIGEAAVDYGNQITLKSTDNIGARHIAWRSFEAGAEFAQRWIPTKDELPEVNNETILAKPIKGTVRLIRVDDEVTQVIIKHSYTHWRLIELI